MPLPTDGVEKELPPVLYDDRYRMQIRRRIAKLVRRHRETLGISQQDLSIELGRTHRYVGKVESARCDLNLAELLVLARMLAIDPGELIIELVAP